MTDKDGDDDKTIHLPDFRGKFDNLGLVTAYEMKITKVALDTLFIQREIESAREEYVKLGATIQAAEEKLEKASEQIAAERSSSPPRLARFAVALLAPESSAQAQLGDYEEMFAKNVARIGVRKARQIYWLQVSASLRPLAWAWIKRMGFVTLVVDYVRSKFGL
ncbi:permease prefix domain 2-containing transporter [Bradyrhizobium daqingense]|uniref:Uncharacterized protein n=1 Tax=Bradyrhizobium daqingense TaxID=993502 RepID=A0A562LME9_9BRAD|nr:permease prefix domain 2-containing transporter [Bradyrhizobium daqingense]TWI08792.1 hypothetical protein IQ17_01615 [Bradyrhizobium daqingense]UFS87293.1 permease prefix domain 2-containing transporter [Bradyrhizobium daqingense]